MTRLVLVAAVLLGSQSLAHAGHGPNRALADDPSPYLQLHAEDPVHWRRWEAATIEEASACPVPAISNAVPWSGDVRMKGRPIVTFTPSPKETVLKAAIPTS